MKEVEKKNKITKWIVKFGWNFFKKNCKNMLVLLLFIIYLPMTTVLRYFNT